MTTWTSATATCTWSVGSLIQMARTSRPWKLMLPRVWMLPWAPWTHCSTPSSDNTTGLGDELCPGGHEWRHLSLQGLPDDPAQLRMWCQGDLVKAPGRLADGWRWKIWWCSGKHRPDQLLADDCRLHSDMLLQEWLVPNNVNVWLVLSCSQPHGLWWQARISCMHQGGHPGGAQVKVIPSEQLHLEKVLTASGAKYPLAHVVTRHCTLAAGVSMADMDSLFTGQISTKVLISLVSNEAFVSTWQKNTFNFAHTELNSACLVVNGRPLPAQPGQPDFMQGLYAETYHALLKFSGMYPSYWSNGMSVEHFVDGIMLLSWDLTPDDSNGVAYLSPRHLGTITASLRFAKLLLATTTLIAYAQYDNLVVVDAYQCLHHWHLPAWFPAAYLINTAHGGDAGEHWLGVFLKDSQHAEYFNSFGIAPPESIYRRLLSMDYLDIWYSTKMLQGLFSRSCGLYAFYFLAMCSRGVLFGIITGAFQKYDYSEAQIRCLLRWHTHAYTQRQRPLIIIRSPVYIGETVNASTLFFLAIETPPSSWSPRFWPWDGIQPAWCLAAMCMERDDLPEAGHCPSYSHPAHSMLLFLDSQSETWKHASPLTVRSITDAGGSI